MRFSLNWSNWRHRISDVFYLSKSSLHIHPMEKHRDILEWKHPHSDWQRKFATLHVGNEKKKTARECSATLFITSAPEYAEHMVTGWPLLWQDTDYWHKNIGTQFVTIDNKPLRIKLAFTDSNRALAGYWVANEDALFKSTMARAYLPEGIYEAIVKVTCSNCKDDFKKYRIFSPRTWDGLDIEEIEM